MRLINGEQLIKIGLGIGRIAEFLRTGESGRKKVADKAPLSDDDKKSLNTAFTNFKKVCDEIDAKVTSLAISDAVKLLKSKMNHSDLRDSILEIDKTLQRELRSYNFVLANLPKSEYLDGSECAFGKEVASQFPSMIFEIQEAARCQAVDLHTACIFHLMRSMEILLKSIHCCLGLPTPTGSGKNWGNLLNAIKGAMNHKNLNSGWTGDDKSIFEDLYASFDVVRVAWRNTTMHVEKQYDGDEAEHIFIAVKALARKMASRMDEDGLPLA